MQYCAAWQPYILRQNISRIIVKTTLTATDPTIGTVQQINIGKAATPQIFTIDTSTGPLNLLQAARSAVTFGDPGSTFGLTSNTGQTVTFYNSLAGTVGNGGILKLSGTSGDGTNALVLQSSDGTKTLGTGANKLAVLNINGNVVINGSPTTKLDVSNTLALNISKVSLPLPYLLLISVITKDQVVMDSMLSIMILI
jgi:hypothetical protein